MLVQLNLALPLDQVADFDLLAKLRLTFRALGRSDVVVDLPPAERNSRAPGLPYLERFDLMVEGLAAAGALEFYGRRDGIVLSGGPSLNLTVPVRRLDDFGQVEVPMQAARRRHTATVLLGGQVLIAGGEDPLNGAPLASTEIYDPGTRRFLETGSLRHARSRHAAVRLADGRVLVAGGVGPAGAYPRRLEIYDPGSGAFAEVAELSVGRTDMSASRYVAGGVERVLLAGGRTSTGPKDVAESYAPAFDTFSAPRSMSSPRAEHAAVEVGTGVLFTGGHPSNPVAEVFRASTEAFELTGSMEAPRPRARAVVTDAGRILVAGAGDSLESFDATAGRFGVVTRFAVSRDEVALAAVPGDRLLVAGGGGEAAPLRGAEILEGGTVRATRGLLDTPRVGHTLSILPDGTVLVAGGAAGATAEVYQPLLLAPPR